MHTYYKRVHVCMPMCSAHQRALACLCGTNFDVMSHNIQQCCGMCQNSMCQHEVLMCALWRTLSCMLVGPWLSIANIVNQSKPVKAEQECHQAANQNMLARKGNKALSRQTNDPFCCSTPLTQQRLATG